MCIFSHLNHAGNIIPVVSHTSFVVNFPLCYYINPLCTSFITIFSYLLLHILMKNFLNHPCTLFPDLSSLILTNFHLPE